jgi:hypothetical protein
VNAAPQAAARLRAMEGGDAAMILDTLTAHPCPDGTRLIDAGGHRFRCLIARHRDGSPVLLSIHEVNR